MAQVTPHLLALPREIRDMIYAFALLPNEPREILLPDPPLLQVSRQLRDEAAELYYTQTASKLTVTRTFFATAPVCLAARPQQWLDSIPTLTVRCFGEDDHDSLWFRKAGEASIHAVLVAAGYRGDRVVWEVVGSIESEGVNGRWVDGMVRLLGAAAAAGVEYERARVRAGCEGGVVCKRENLRGLRKRRARHGGS
ncbi:hypothetical protein LTR36_005678 [Oleoguttula mirabilis]|uniref:F-box domain-containing protein n=1 Tax=Oleoguttula mirabilis TaxID=1507867 RepID=A0AAV9JDU5_9PEZI|nr:hypothetical protein LTR36_005678 [Oleoguttula mirabilis]